MFTLPHPASLAAPQTTARAVLARLGRAARALFGQTTPETTARADPAAWDVPRNWLR